MKKCFNHPDRDATSIVDVPVSPELVEGCFLQAEASNCCLLCDECAAVERDKGVFIRKIQGYLFGFPIVFNNEGDDILDSTVIDA